MLAMFVANSGPLLSLRDSISDGRLFIFLDIQVVFIKLERLDKTFYRRVVHCTTDCVTDCICCTGSANSLVCLDISMLCVVCVCVDLGVWVGLSVCVCVCVM